MDGLVATPRAAALREELRLLPADANADGSPAWLVQDPVANRFFRIGWLDFEILRRWQDGSAQDIARAIAGETTLDAQAEDVAALRQFLADNELLQARDTPAVDGLRRRASARSRGAGDWLLHHYLFFRVPLVRPQAALERLMPRIGWLFSAGMLAAVFIAGAIGLALVLHQWDSFASTFAGYFTWQGAFGFAAALAVAKTLHELGHAVTATHYGVRVAHMGVAMVVMFPMLYTDTTESWKLSNPRRRLAIAAAGMLAELALAAVATLLWVLSPDGAFRTAMFFLASTSWVLSLLVNASPFMRFDGYFILCDLLNFPNLHERAGAFARVALRRAVPGLYEPWPEDLPHARRRWLIAFAVATWAWRLGVFLGIAVLVYAFFFKLLGLVLAAVEVGWFIVRPVVAELKAWDRRRDELHPLRLRAGAMLLCVLVLLLVLPWQSGVPAGGVVRAVRQHAVFAPRAGELKAMPPGTDVQAGEFVFVLAAPELQGAAQRSRVLAEARGQELAGLAAQAGGEERRAIIESERERLLAEAEVYSGEQSRLQLAAPFAGRLVDVDPQLKPGVWVHPRQPLAMLIDTSGWVAEVFVAETDAARIRPGDAARVYIGTHAMDGRVAQVGDSRAGALPYDMLDAAAGGPIATLPRTGERGERIAQAGLFRVRIDLAGAPPQQRMALCEAVIAGTPRSLLQALLGHVAGVLIRESGF